MKIGKFLKLFRAGVKHQNNDVPISAAALASILKIKAHTIRNSEKNDYVPRDENDRVKLKSYFGIDNFEDIPEEKLDECIKNFDLKKELEKLFAESGNTINNNKLFHSKEVDSSSKDQQSGANEDETFGEYDNNELNSHKNKNSMTLTQIMRSNAISRERESLALLKFGSAAEINAENQKNLIQLLQQAMGLKEEGVPLGKTGGK